ncbi:hypothetical protein [Streptomyces sp. NPDC088794]|uniref:hypothetical protein n=1 Tax=Streptomyces sp. NPDC088794 TaxID=3365902 RepID=UPI0037FC2CC0
MPVVLTLTAEKHKVNGEGRYEVNLAFDTAPLVDHCRTEHPDNAPNKPEGEGTSAGVHASGGVTVHIHRASHDDAATLARSIARSEAKVGPLGIGRL